MIYGLRRRALLFQGALETWPTQSLCFSVEPLMPPGVVQWPGLRARGARHVAYCQGVAVVGPTALPGGGPGCNPWEKGLWVGFPEWRDRLAPRGRCWPVFRGLGGRLPFTGLVIVVQTLAFGTEDSTEQPSEGTLYAWLLGIWGGSLRLKCRGGRVVA